MSELLNELFAAEHRAPRELLARLDAGELLELEATVRGEAHKPYRVRAMGALVDARGAGATGVLAQVLSRRNEDSAVRAAAAFQLGRAGPPAEKQLIAAIRGRPQTTVAFAAAGALAKVGTPAAIAPLKALAKRDDALGAQARFAATVVAFRHHLKGQEPRASARAKILELPRRGRAPLFSRALERPEAMAAFEDLRHDTYGMRLAPGRALRLDCGPERYLIALNPDAAELDRPNIAGLVAQRAPTDNSYSVSRLVLTWRGRDGVINVGVFRPSGQLAFAGTATEKGQRTTFRLQSVAGRGNPPADVRGILEAGKIVQMTGSAAAIRPTRSAPTAE
jgi:hypothetical protein